MQTSMAEPLRVDNVDRTIQIPSLHSSLGEPYVHARSFDNNVTVFNSTSPNSGKFNQAVGPVSVFFIVY